jgi:hypothetical protein
MEPMNHALAEQQIERFFALQAQKSDLDNQMKEIKTSLQAFAEANKEKFVDGIYMFDCCGYLRYGKKTVVKLNKSRFDLLKLIKAFPLFIKKEWIITAIKASFSEAKNIKRAKELGLTLTSIDLFDVVRKDMVEEEAKETSHAH